MLGVAADKPAELPQEVLMDIFSLLETPDCCLLLLELSIYQHMQIRAVQMASNTLPYLHL
jgi:hypothetical protein